MNANVIVENLTEESLVAQRIVHDHICEVGGVLEVPLSKCDVFTSDIIVWSVQFQYVTAMETKKTESGKAEKQKELQTEIQELTNRKKTL